MLPAAVSAEGTITLVVVVLVVVGFIAFGLRAVRIMRDRPDRSEFLRRWFGR